MDFSTSIVQVIQAMLAPGVMINACGLLLLGMNNKYSMVVNRTRLLNEERRRFFSKAGERDFSYEENLRIGSINLQLGRLVDRVKLVRNAVLCYTIAIAIFVMTSISIGLTHFTNTKLDLLSTVLFLMGMLSVMIGVTFAAAEVKKGFDIIQLEVKIDE